MAISVLLQTNKRVYLVPTIKLLLPTIFVCLKKLFTTISITFEHSFRKHMHLFDNYYKIDHKTETCECNDDFENRPKKGRPKIADKWFIPI